tara:strand:- start:3211 stop:4059 length:849 start_codon:yes stop_codon:yes gene_type:complete
MKITITLLALLVACSATAAELPNGIYSVDSNDSDSGNTVTRADSQEPIKLQKLLASGLGTPSLISTSNDNESFRLTLSKAGPFRQDIKSTHQAAYIDGVCVIGTGQVLDNQQRSTLVGYFNSIDNANKVAKAFSIKPKLRQHPGHKVIVKWTPQKPSFNPNDPIELTLTVMNVGKVDINFIAGGSQRGARDNQFAFIAHSDYRNGKAVPDTGDPVNFGGIGSFVNLKPNESFTKSVDVSKWFRFTESGSYQLTCMYHIEMSSDDGDLWDDFLTGQCLVRIKK